LGALKRSNRHRFQLLTQQAGLFAEQFVLADAAADSGERALLADFLVGSGKISLRHQADKAFDINMQGTSGDTHGVFALKAAQRLNADLIRAKAQRHLRRALHAHLGRPHGQYLARSLRIWFGFGFYGDGISLPRSRLIHSFPLRIA
jgi:hypothetical protein